CYIGKALPEEYKKLIHKDTQNKKVQKMLKSEKESRNNTDCPGSIVRSSSIYNDFKQFLSIDLTQNHVSVLNHLSKLRTILRYINKPIDEITKDDLRRFLAMVNEKYSVQSYNCFIKTIRRFFRDYLGKSELTTFKFKTVPFTPKVNGLSKNDLLKFYNAIEHPIVKMMFHAYCVTGLRRNDIISLKKDELFRESRMVVRNNGSRTKHRWVTFYNQELANVLHPYLDSRTDNNFRVFPVDKYKTFQKHWKLAQLKTGLKVTPKDLRDWFINEMLRLGVSESYVDALVGHIPKSVLAKHYIQYNPETLKEIYDKANLKLFS
ncbi:MAG: site-specific integrase, partial [Candidatus Methanomethylicia archaeon]